MTPQTKENDHDDKEVVSIPLPYIPTGNPHAGLREEDIAEINNGNPGAIPADPNQPPTT